MAANTTPKGKRTPKATSYTDSYVLFTIVSIFKKNFGRYICMTGGIITS
jgi:hypothetical protein